jgi:PadR family transcriptional regulator, regulatory protein PadR
MQTPFAQSGRRFTTVRTGLERRVLPAALGGSHAERKPAHDEHEADEHEAGRIIGLAVHARDDADGGDRKRSGENGEVGLHEGGLLPGDRVPCTSMHSSSTPGGALHIDKDLVAASATPLVLAILADDESYGYAILKRVRELSGGAFAWTDGMLYPLLHRLGRLGYVTTEWRTSPEGRRRKYYAITDDGRAALADQQRQWLAVTRALNDIWRGPGAVMTTLGEA